MKLMAVISPVFRWLGVGLILVLMLTTGCGTLENGRGWGQDAIYPVSWKRVGNAAKNAVLDPVTWVSAGGAAIFAIDDFDERTSAWATKHTPIFGSVSGAASTSDDINTVLEAEVWATALLTASGSDFPQWGLAKLRGGLVEYGALEAVSELTSLGKSLTDRERPDESDRRSFPSQAASKAFATIRLSNRNLDSIEMPPWLRTTIKSGNYVAASGAAWARVEGERHYPSDVLAGACLGNLVTTFIHDAFMNLPDDSTFSFYIEPSPSGVYAAISFEF
jgi:membrane-associated phospholipid phosphatase